MYIDMFEESQIYLCVCVNLYENSHLCTESIVHRTVSMFTVNRWQVAYMMTCLSHWYTMSIWFHPTSRFPLTSLWCQRFPQEVGWKTVDKAGRWLEKRVEVDELFHPGQLRMDKCSAINEKFMEIWTYLWFVTLTYIYLSMITYTTANSF